MCGEHGESIGGHDTILGSPPHVRGASALIVDEHLNIGITPACAGSITAPYVAPAFSKDHPRMCGEHAVIESYAEARLGSPPHVRGASNIRALIKYNSRITPACAGSMPL